MQNSLMALAFSPASASSRITDLVDSPLTTSGPHLHQLISRSEVNMGILSQSTLSTLEKLRNVLFCCILTPSRQSNLYTFFCIRATERWTNKIPGKLRSQNAMSAWRICHARLALCIQLVHQIEISKAPIDKVIHFATMTRCYRCAKHVSRREKAYRKRLLASSRFN
jgi:hypothetical protein